MDFNTVEEFEGEISSYFGSPYAIATDSCTHSIELCLRYLNPTYVECPCNTYISIPFTLMKINCQWNFNTEKWQKYYFLNKTSIIDAATFFEKDGYIKGTFMCLSFQFQKHLSLGRGGMILCDDKNAYKILKKMVYDGRMLNTPWAFQNIESIGYHYYMTPETASLGLEKLNEAKNTTPRIWNYNDYPDLRQMKVFDFQ
jgi:dTDP-4-amino-4,6-dideoxygalactose transaminase